MAKINIMSWNANGLKNRIHELVACLVCNDIQICLICETHDTVETKYKIRGYTYYNTVHPSNNARGGTGIFIKSDIKHDEHIQIQANRTQVTSVKVQLDDSRMITVASIYNPPNQCMTSDDYKTLFQSLGHMFILGGDFNAKHTFFGSRLTTVKGRELYQAICDINCQIVSTGNPTHFPTDINKKPDLLDFFVIKNVSSNYFTIDDCN